MKLINKDTLIEKLWERRIKHRDFGGSPYSEYGHEDDEILSLIDTLEVKEVDLEKERMSECPYRQVGCTMYEGHVLECNGACSWVVDYPILKRLKAQKGEKV